MASYLEEKMDRGTLRSYMLPIGIAVYSDHTFMPGAKFGVTTYCHTPAAVC